MGSMVSYTFANVVTDHTIGATFALVTGSHHVIHASAGANGQITPEGDVIVNDRANQQFNIVADLHYHIASVLVDGTLSWHCELLHNLKHQSRPHYNRNIRDKYSLP